MAAARSRMRKRKGPGLARGEHAFACAWTFRCRDDSAGGRESEVTEVREQISAFGDSLGWPWVPVRFCGAFCYRDHVERMPVFLEELLQSISILSGRYNLIVFRHDVQDGNLGSGNDAGMITESGHRK